jgi:hypothetical protein
MNKESVLPQTVAMDGISQTVGGLTKRELFAALAMQALVTNWTALGDYEMGASEVAVDAVNYADKLLARLEETNVRREK